MCNILKRQVPIVSCEFMFQFLRSHEHQNLIKFSTMPTVHSIFSQSISAASRRWYIPNHASVNNVPHQLFTIWQLVIPGDKPPPSRWWDAGTKSTTRWYLWDVPPADAPFLLNSRSNSFWPYSARDPVRTKAAIAAAAHSTIQYL